MKTLKELSGKRVLFRHAQMRTLHEGRVREFAGENSEYVRIDYEWFDVGNVNPIAELPADEPFMAAARQQQQQQQQEPAPQPPPAPLPDGSQPPPQPPNS